jgi:hypothetical protein
MTEETELFLVSLLEPLPGLSGVVPVRQSKADNPLVRPIVLVSAQYHETLIPSDRPVARINYEVILETQVNETDIETHQDLIGVLALGLPTYGLFTGGQTTFDQVFFGPITGAQDTKNELIRSYTFQSYLVGRLTVPTP